MKAIIDLDRMEKDLNERLLDSPYSSIKFQDYLANIMKEFVMQYVIVEKDSEIK